jgi:DNA-binding transcriptional MerR regulator
MPYKERPIERLYYSIGEVASMLGVNTSMVRFWEKEFDILKPKKNKKGNRYFTPEDVANIKLIYHLVKERGYTLAGAKVKLKSKGDEIEHEQKIVEKLQNIKAQLLSLKDEMD